MSVTPAQKHDAFPKAHGHDLVENLSASATPAAIALTAFWVTKAITSYLPAVLGWATALPSIIAIGAFIGALWLSQRSTFRDAMCRWRYVAAFGLIFWLGTLFQAGHLP